MQTMPPTHRKLATQLAALFAPLPQVEAIAVAGSLGSGPGTSDGASDIDLYVYTRGTIPLDTRLSIAEETDGFSRSNFDLNYWGSGDLWVHAPTGIEIDVMYFEAEWMQNQIAEVVEHYQPRMGYTTCFWYTVRQSLPLHDKHGWFAALQRRCAVDYPDALRHNIITYNYPLLRNILTSYEEQIAKAARRRDLVSVNHRIAAMLASYFDILFALNRQLHPGEKRLINFAVRQCQMLPDDFETDLESILAFSADEAGEIPARVARLLDHFDVLVARSGSK